MPRLRDEEFAAILAAAEKTRFPQFWADLLLVIRTTRYSPARIITGRRPVTAPEIAREAALRLWREDCPYAVGSSRFAKDALERGLREIAREAWRDDWEKFRFSWLC